MQQVFPFFIQLCKAEVCAGRDTALKSIMASKALVVAERRWLKQRIWKMSYCILVLTFILNQSRAPHASRNGAPQRDCERSCNMSQNLFTADIKNATKRYSNAGTPELSYYGFNI